MVRRFDSASVAPISLRIKSEETLLQLVYKLSEVIVINLCNCVIWTIFVEKVMLMSLPNGFSYFFFFFCRQVP